MGRSGSSPTPSPLAPPACCSRTFRSAATRVWSRPSAGAAWTASPWWRLRRLASTVGGGSGFVYLISRLGVTGTHTTIGTEVEHMVERIRTCTSLPVAVGFGITGAEQAAAVARYADGIVVGSALVERMGRDAAAARELVRTLRQALDAVGVAG
ncbi:MAG: tryptophan synthase subunit alpha [Gemmatimonadota bacterium]|nr:tryptophan synthase subunit alpha [Gemmatimonadota bacterium]